MSDALRASLFAPLLSVSVFLMTQRLFFRPQTHGIRWLSGLLTAWGVTLLLPSLAAWQNAGRSIAGPGGLGLPFLLVFGFLAGIFMAAEALMAALFYALSRTRR